MFQVKIYNIPDNGLENWTNNAEHTFVLTHPVHNIAFSPSMKNILASSADSVLTIFDLNTMQKTYG